jgi:hypothetical protein
MINKFYLLIDEILDRDIFPRTIKHVHHEYISLDVPNSVSLYLEISCSKYQILTVIRFEKWQKFRCPMILNKFAESVQ